MVQIVQKHEHTLILNKINPHGLLQEKIYFNLICELSLVEHTKFPIVMKCCFGLSPLTNLFHSSSP